MKMNKLMGVLLLSLSLTMNVNAETMDKKETIVEQIEQHQKQVPTIKSRINKGKFDDIFNTRPDPKETLLVYSNGSMITVEPILDEKTTKADLLAKLKVPEMENANPYTDFETKLRNGFYKYRNKDSYILTKNIQNNYQCLVMDLNTYPQMYELLQLASGQPNGNHIFNIFYQETNCVINQMLIKRQETDKEVAFSLYRSIVAPPLTMKYGESFFHSRKPAMDRLLKKLEHIMLREQIYAMKSIS